MRLDSFRTGLPRVGLPRSGLPRLEAVLARSGKEHRRSGLVRVGSGLALFCFSSFSTAVYRSLTQREIACASSGGDAGERGGHRRPWKTEDGPMGLCDDDCDVLGGVMVAARGISA